MTDFEMKLSNDINIETVLKSIIKETSKWEFKTADYIKLVNALLDLSLDKRPASTSDKLIMNNPNPGRLDLPLTGDQIQIRIFNRETDYKIIQKWLEDEFGCLFLLSRLDTKNNSLEQLIEDDRNILGLITLPDSTPIGLMGFLDYDNIHHKAEMRKLIGEEEYRERGYAKEATMLWIQYGINNLELKKIYLYTIENNIRNVSLNKELGFMAEGILRKECLIGDKYSDLLRMGLIVD